MTARQSDERAITPVVAIVLMTAVTVALLVLVGIHFSGAITGGLDQNPEAAVTVDVDETTPRVVITVADPGNLEGGRMVDPHGNRSAVTIAVASRGTQIILEPGGYPTGEFENTTEPLDPPYDCWIDHQGMTIDYGEQAGDPQNIYPHEPVPCNGDGILAASGDRIQYEHDSEYRFVGVIGATEGVLQTVQTPPDPNN